VGKARTRTRTSVDILDPLIQESFWAHIDKDGPLPVGAPWLGRCWLWTGPVTPSGYGSFSHAGRRWPAHHFAFLTRSEDLVRPARLDQLCHSWSNRTCRGGRDCPHRRCVLHLEEVTEREYAHRHAPFNPYVQYPTRRLIRPRCEVGHPWTELHPVFDPVGRRACPSCARAGERPPS
jgi:hypothetical protein